MKLNTIKPTAGAKHVKARVGRGVGSGLGKTCGRGHKGQKARSGGKVSIGFEGGQMPLHRRLPKLGFTSKQAKYTAEIRLSELNKLSDMVTLESLQEADLINHHIRKVRIIATGEINKALVIGKNIHLTKGAEAAIKTAGGKVEA